MKASVLQLVSFLPTGPTAPKTWEALPLKVRLAEIMSHSLSWSFLLCFSTCYDMTLQLYCKGLSDDITQFVWLPVILSVLMFFGIIANIFLTQNSLVPCQYIWSNVCFGTINLVSIAGLLLITCIQIFFLHHVSVEMECSFFPVS